MRFWTCLLIAILWAMPSAQASEGGFGTYPAGFQDIRSGILPPPGWYFRESLEFYSGSVTQVVREGLLEADLHLSLPVQYSALSQVTKSRLWGSNYSWVLIAPVVEPTLEGSVLTPTGPVMNRASITGLSQLYVMPLVLGWHNGRSHQKAWFAFYAPTGKYDVRDFLNTSLNRWAIEFDYGYTYLDPKTGCEFDLAPGYTINFENPATAYRSGNEFHMDWVAMKHLTPTWGVGAVGYAWIQTTPDSGAGAMLGAMKGRAFALGPMVTHSTRVGSAPINLVGKYYDEFGVKNRFAGHSYWLNVSAAF